MSALMLGVPMIAGVPMVPGVSMIVLTIGVGPA